jgi:putative DNA primase/helicase
LLKFETRRGVEQEAVLPLADIYRPGASGFLSVIAKGLVIEPLGREIALLKKYLTGVVPEREAVVTERCGWLNGDTRNYVTPDRIIGASRGGLVRYTGASNGFTRRGSLAGWRRHVAGPAVGNARLMFAVMVALAAPLLKIAGEQSGGFHFRGLSSSGKTTALHLAASVHGAKVRNWNSTANGIEADCVAHNDACLLLDEIGQANPKVVAQTSYQAINGIGRGRMNADRHSEPSATWTIMLLSSGEISLADRIASGPGTAPQAGQGVRIVDIPADAGAGLGIFDELPEGFAKPAAAADALRRAAERHRGHALPVFVRGLIERGDTTQLAAQIDRERRAWVRNHVSPNADGQVVRIAQRFALTAAAGRLAVELDVLPWQATDVDWAVKEVFHAWLRERGHQGPAEVDAVLTRLRDLIARHGASRFQRLNETAELDASEKESRERVIDRAGYVRSWDGGREYLIWPSVWDREILKGVERKPVHAALLKQGALRGDSEGKASLVVKVEGVSRRFYAVDEAALDGVSAQETGP